MNIFMYISNEETATSLKEYAAVHYEKVEVIEESSSLMIDWRDRPLNDAINRAEAGDKLIVLDALNLARSHMQVLSFLETALEKKIIIQFIKYGLTFKAEPTCNFNDLIHLVREIENDFVSKRNHEIITHRKDCGIRLGRPAGKKNASLKLDKYKSDIAHYLRLSVSKASIAKLVDCHPQTLSNWLERNETKENTSPHSRPKKTEKIDS